MMSVFRLLVAIISLGLSSFATAQSTETDVSFQRVMTGITASTSGVNTITVGSGTTAAVERTAAGTVAVAADGFTIPVATTVAADVGASTIALGAARIALRMVPWVGGALVLADIAGQIGKAGYVVCPPPNFFCKPSIRLATGFYYYDSSHNYYAPDAIDVCNEVYSYTSGATWSISGIKNKSIDSTTGTGGVYCEVIVNNVGPRDGVSITRAACPPGGAAGPPNSGCGGTQASLSDPATLPDLQSVLTAQYQADQALIKKMHDEQVALEQANPGLAPPMDISTSPIKVTAPSVSAPPLVVSQTTVTNPDGSTSTIKVTKTVTVNPAISTPATVASPNVTFPSTSTSTTTTTNNTTNVSTSTTTVVNNPAVVPNKPTDIPTDYNREATQLKILNALNGTDSNGMPSAALAGGDTAITSIGTQNNLGSSAVASISDSGVGITNWFPKIPTAECVNPQVPNPLTGAMVDVVVCDKVNMFSSFISGVIAVFCLYGCISSVSAAIKS